MRLNLSDIIHVPGASRSFRFSLDVSDLDFDGQKPFASPVQVEGAVRNMAGALVLECEAVSELQLTCDRCLKEFSKVWTLPVNSLLAEELEDEENDDIILLEHGELDLDEVITTALVLSMETKHLCSEDCKGLCPGCGVDLNTETCTCKKEIDPRLQKLAALLEQSSEN